MIRLPESPCSWRRQLHLVPTALAAAALLVMTPARAVGYNWTAGNFVAGTTAPNPLPVDDTLFGLAGSDKNFSGVAFTNQGTVAWQTTDRIGFVSSSVTNSALWDLQADANLTYAGGGASPFSNTGTFRKSGGAGSSVIGGNILFSNTGTIDAQTGTIDFAGGSATFNAGTQFTGAGTARVSNTATFAGAFTSANLLLASGTFNGTSATLAGHVRWTGGSIAGTWQVDSGHTLAAQGGIDKNFSGASFTNLGTVAWQTIDRIGFVSSSVTNSGLWDLQADANLTYAGGGASTFSNTGTFRKSGGAGSSVIGGNIVFSNTGTIEAQTGTIDFAGGSATFNAGTQFTGAGTVRVSNTANFAGAFTSANLVLAGGNFNGDNTTPAVLNGSVRWTGGNIAGTWQVASGQTLTVLDGSDKNFSGTNFTNNGTVVWQSAERAGFVSSAVSNTALWNIQADANLTYAGGGASPFSNTGTLRKSGGAGSSVIGGNIVFSNTGTIDAQTGTIDFAGGSATFNAGTQFTGAGTVRVSNTANFAGAFTSANLVLAGGTFSGDNTTPAVLNGSVRWTGGSVAGTWQVGSGQTLTVLDGIDKNFSGTNFTNNGTVVWQSAERAGFVSSAVSNTALWDIQADANLTYVGGGASTFSNTGTFRKSVGTGSSVIGGNVVFSNTGTIDAQTGTIDFAGGSVTFNAGTQFTGAGIVRVSNTANFAGAFTSANLVLAGGTFAGDNTTPAALNGSVRWTGGSFAGTWQVGNGQTLTAQDGAAKNFAGANFTNSGTLRWESDQNAGFVSSAFFNAGLFDLRSDADIVYAGGSASTFTNTGVLRKNSGDGISLVTGNITFSNPGSIEALSGTLQFANNLANPGTVRGTATVQTALLTNTGLVAPGAAAGAAPATLTLTGSFTQGVAGTLEIDVGPLASHDLLVVTGSVNLGGTLGVACYGACFFDVGDEIEVLDYAGTRSGSTFAGLTTSGFATGGFEAIYDDANTRVLLRVTSAVTPVPEPGPSALLLAGLAVLAGVARRRMTQA